MRFQSVRSMLVSILAAVFLTVGCAAQPTEPPKTAVPAPTSVSVSVTKPTTVSATPTQAVPPTTAPAKAEVVEIEFLHPWGGDFGKFIGELVDKYNASQTTAKVKAVQVGATYEEILAKVQARLAANDPPDISIQGFPYTDYSAEKFTYQTLDVIVNDPQFNKADVPASFLRLGQYKGKQVALPFAVSTPVMFYNVDLFKKAGLDPNRPPKTWDEVMTYAKQLTKDTNNDGKPDQFGVYFNQHAWYFQNLVQSAGGVLMTEDGKIAFNQEPGVKSMQFLQDLVKAGVMPSLTSAQGQASFTAGTIGMYATTSAFNQSVTKAATFEVRAAEFPYLTKRSVAAGGANIWVFSKNPAKQKEAYNFIRWVTSKEGTTIISTSTGYMPIRMSVLNDPAYMADFMKRNPNFWAAQNQVDVMTPWQNFPGGTKIPSLLLSAWQEVLTGASPKDVLDRGAKEATSIIAQEQ